MATLTGKSIESTYPSLLKTNDEAALDPTLEKVIQDGLGNNSTLSLSQASASFSGNLDLSAASVTGAPVDVDAGNGIIKVKGNTVPANTAINLSPTNNPIGQGGPVSIAIGFDSFAAENSIFIGRFGASSAGSTITGINSYTGTPNSGIFGYGNAINSQGGVEDQNYIVGYGNTFPADSGITNTHVIGNGVTADESNVLMTNKPVKGTGFKTAGYGEVIDNAGNWVGQPIGGGGGELVNTLTLANGIQMGTNTSSLNYKLTYSSPSFSVSNLAQLENTLHAGVITMLPGQVLNSVAVWISGASVAGSLRLGLYKSKRDVDGYLTIGDLEVDFGTISTATVGEKVITNINHTLGATEGSMYFYAYISDEQFGLYAAGHSGANVVSPAFGTLSSSIITKAGVFTAGLTYGALPTTPPTIYNSPGRYPIVGFA